MTESDVIDAAREVGLNGMFSDSAVHPVLLRFAAIIEAKTREKCARICESRVMGDNNREDAEAKRCANAIREQG